MHTKFPGSNRTWRVGTLTYTFGSLATLFGWLLWGDFAVSIRDRAIPAVMQLVFRKFGASDMVTGLLFASLPSMLGLIIVPIVGYKSDRLRTRWGRRIPFLIVTTPFMVVALVGLAFCPQLGGYFDRFLGHHSPGASASALIVLSVLWIVFETAVSTANFIFGALVNDVVPQEVLGRFFGLFRAVSLIAGIIFSYWLMGQAETYFSWIFIGVAFVYGIGFTLTCLNVREGSYPPPRSAAGALKAIRTYFKDGFGHSYYLWFFAATILGNLAASPFNLYSVFYAKSVAMNMIDYGKCVALTFVFSLCLSYPLGVLADRFHPLRVSIAALVLYAGAMVYGYLFVRDAGTFGIALVVHGVIAGTYGTTAASLGQRLLPRSKFAEIASAGGILGSLSGILMAPALGTFLDHQHHAYRYTFLVGFSFSSLALVALAVLHGKFMSLGGPDHYVAPG